MAVVTGASQRWRILAAHAGLIALIARKRELIASMIGDLLGAVAGGDLEVVVGNTYPLSEAARAHEDIQERQTTGKLLLDPSA